MVAPGTGRPGPLWGHLIGICGCFKSRAGTLSPEEVISGKEQYDGGWGLGLTDPGLFCLWLLVEASGKP